MMRRRGIILYGVLLLVMIGTLIAATLLVLIDGEMAGSAVGQRRAKVRAAAWSGVQGVMQELWSQREDLVAGGVPELTASWSFEGGDGGGGARGITIRLLAAPDGALASSESARLDVNRATPEMLAGLGGGDAGGTDGLSGGRPYSSVASVVASTGNESLRGLISVYSADVERTLGVVSPEGVETDVDAERRAVPEEWTPELDEDLRVSLGESGRAFFEWLAGLETPPGTISDMVRGMRQAQFPTESWGYLLDQVRLTEDPVALGRIDINRASAEVLACLPGVEREDADQIVFRREQLEGDVLRSVAWPVTEGILSDSSFETACDWMTTRSLQWRVVVEAGFSSGEDAAFDSALDFGSAEGETSSGDALGQSVVLEFVVDVTGDDGPRLASLKRVAHPSFARTVGTVDDGSDASSVDAPVSVSDGPEMEADAPVRLRPPEAPEASRSDDGAGESSGSGIRRVGRWLGSGEGGGR